MAKKKKKKKSKEQLVMLSAWKLENGLANKKATSALKKLTKKTTAAATASLKIADLGQWGDIAFRVNANQVMTFQKMKRSYGAQWASHNIIGKRPKTEFQGPKMDEVTMDIILDAELGVKPRAVMNQLRTAAKAGKAYYLYINGKKVAVNKYYIDSGTENWEKIWNKGELARATVSLTFKEYR